MVEFYLSDNDGQSVQEGGDTVTDERLYSKTDAASYLGVSEKTIERWIASGKLVVSKRVGKSPRWTKDELDAALSEQPDARTAHHAAEPEQPTA